MDAPHALVLHLHLPVQRPRHHPDHLHAGDGPDGDPDVPRPRRVGDVQRRRVQAPEARLPHPHVVAARCADGDEAARGAHRVRVEHPAAAFRPDDPTFRQHARRSHAARHVRHPHRGVGAERHGRLEAVGGPPVLHARVRHRVRGAGPVPAGIHLHDPRLRVHRPLDGGPRRARRAFRCRRPAHRLRRTARRDRRDAAEAVA